MSKKKVLFRVGVVAMPLVMFGWFYKFPVFCKKAKMNRYVKAFVEQGLFSGSVLVAKGGKILLCKGYGMADYENDIPNTLQTKFNLASVTKQFTAAAIMILQQKGLLSVEDPISKYIPGYPHGDEITIHDLLSHTSGIPEYFNFIGDYSVANMPPSLNEIIELFKNEPLEFTPGERHEYSNSNYILLSFIIEKVSQKSLAQFMQENIFQQLNMVGTGFDYDPTDEKFAVGYVAEDENFNRVDYVDMSFAYGDGNLISTVEDLYLWDRALYTEKLFSKELLNKMFTSIKDDYGYGWVVSEAFGRKHIWHNGAIDGFHAMISRFVDDDVCIIVLSNLDISSSRVEEMSNGLAAIIFGEKYELPQKAKKRLAIQIDPAIYDQYVGHYKELKEDIISKVTKEDNNLFVQRAGGSKIQLYPESETEFFLKIIDVQISFVKDKHGKVTKLIIHQGGEDTVADKIGE